MAEYDPKKETAKLLKKAFGGAKQKIIGDIASIFRDTYQKAIENELEPVISGLQKKIDGYSKKAQLAAAGQKYLRSGKTELTAADKKKFTSAEARQLGLYLRVNISLKDAKEKARKVSGLERQVKSLEKEKEALGEDLDEQRNNYEEKITKLKNKYGEAVFVKEKLEELRKVSVKGYEKILKDKDLLKSVGEATYYNGKPTEATYMLFETLCLIEARNEIAKSAEEFKGYLRGLKRRFLKNSGSNKKRKKPKQKKPRKK
jgi:hypothetical protein